MSSNCRFKVSLELPTSESGSPLIARPDADVGNSTQTSIAPSSEHLLKKFAKPFERYQSFRPSEPSIPVTFRPLIHNGFKEIRLGQEKTP
jgi:hypothetical protein